MNKNTMKKNYISGVLVTLTFANVATSPSIGE